jgi:diguanylate cyclase
MFDNSYYVKLDGWEGGAPATLSFRAERPILGRVSIVEQARARFAGAAWGDAHTLAAEAVVAAGADTRIRAEALSLLAACEHRLDDYAAAMDTAVRAIDLWRELGDPGGEAGVRATVARVLILTGDMDEALQEALAALEMADVAGDLQARLAALTAVGIVHLSLHQHDLSMEYCERAAETARLLDDEAMHGSLMDTIGCVYLSMAYAARAAGDEPTALACAADAAERCGQGMDTARAVGHRYFEATALGNLAEALAFGGHPEEALRLLENFAVDPVRDGPSTITQHLDTQGCICLALHDYEQAVALFERALALAAGDNQAMFYCEHLADAYEAAGDFKRALEYHRQFHALFKQVASQTAQRSASVAAIRLETSQAKAFAVQERLRAEELYHSNLELARRAEQLLHQSLEDPLTGLANRRGLDRLLAAADRPYAVLLLDVDHFKLVNDGFSHQVGDAVLRELGGLLRQVCRPADVAARYGGEEFAVVLDALDEPGAAVVAERIRATVERHDWTVVAAGLYVTVSVGVAAGRPDGDAAVVLDVADRRLYAAKRDGRNRVVG